MDESVTNDAIFAVVTDLISHVPEKFKPMLRVFYTRIVNLTINADKDDLESVLGLPVLNECALLAVAESDVKDFTADELVLAVQNMLKYVTTMSSNVTEYAQKVSEQVNSNNNVN